MPTRAPGSLAKGIHRSVLALFVLRAGPSLLLWAALLFLPARSVWRRMRAATAA